MSFQSTASRQTLPAFFRMTSMRCTCACFYKNLAVYSTLSLYIARKHVFSQRFFLISLARKWSEWILHYQNEIPSSDKQSCSSFVSECKNHFAAASNSIKSYTHRRSFDWSFIYTSSITLNLSRTVIADWLIETRGPKSSSCVATAIEK